MIRRERRTSRSLRVGRVPRNVSAAARTTAFPSGRKVDLSKSTLLPVRVTAFRGA
jgi:hypothetical protein